MVGWAVVAAFGLGTLPARALPAAAMELIRIDGNGVKAIPAIGAARDRVRLQHDDLAKAPQAPQATKPPLQLAAQSELASSRSLSSFSQSFVAPLPRNLSGNLRLVAYEAKTGTVGPLLKEMPVDSANVLISPDRLQLTVNLQASRAIQPGQSVLLQLPSRTPDGSPIIYPNHLATTPCQFTIAATPAAPILAVAPAAPILAVAPVAAAATVSPLVILGAVIMVGVGVAAAAGAFSGGGGTNSSSQ